MGKKLCSVRLAPGVYLRQIGGWWHLQFYDRRRRPQRKSRALGTPYEHIAYERANDIVRRYVLGIYDPWEQEVAALTLGAALERYLQHQEERGRRPRTIETCRSRIGALVDAAGEGTPLPALTPGAIKKQILRPGLSPTTRYTHYRTFHAWLAWLVEAGYLHNKDISTTLRYRHLKPEHLADAQQGAFDRLERLSKKGAPDASAKALKRVGGSAFTNPLQNTP